MRKKVCSRNLIEPTQKHGLVYEENIIFVKGIDYSGAQYFVVVKDLVVNCCEYCNEISDSVNYLEIIDHMNECQLLKKDSAFWT
jgi:hypothetical protein